MLMRVDDHAHLTSPAIDAFASIPVALAQLAPER